MASCSSPAPATEAATPSRGGLLAVAVLALLGLGAARNDTGPTDKPFPVEAFRGRYLEALATYSRGRGAAASTALYRLEISTLEQRPEVVEAMLEAELGALDGLGPETPGALLPVALLHDAAYLHYLEDGRLQLAVHSRRMVVRLAERLAATSDARASALASDVMTSLAARLQRRHVDGQAAQLYRRALELRADSQAALLGLAEIRERHGEYGRSLELLEALVRLAPESREGRLRLGVNLARAGETDSARRAFQELLRETAADWIQSVAYQELARLEAEGGELDVARALLTEALEQLPEDLTIRIQLAYLDETAGVVSRIDLDRTLAEATRATDGSSRYHYSRTSTAVFEALRRHLVAQQELDLPALRALLTSGSAAGAGA